MSYKTILVHVDEKPRRTERLALAFRIGARCQAHVIALCALAASRIPAYAVAAAGAVVGEIEARSRTEVARAAEAEFRKLERSHGVRAEWRVSEADAAAAMRLSARYADLVVLGQPAPEDGLARAFAEDVLLAGGRPVLFVPYAGHFPDAGQRVLVAWNAGREAARAVTDALPLLAAAQSVEVVVFGEGGGDHGELPGAGLALYLARHGVKATAARQHAPEVDVGAQILSRAADTDADLIVMGAYGRSRLREMVLGGATRTVLESMTVPVLMSH